MTTPPLVVDVAIQQIPLAQLEPNRNNPRRTMHEADLKELAASIRQHGIQVPLLVRPIDFGAHVSMVMYEIICGHRRSEAATLAGLTAVPCMVREMSDQEAAECAIVDNLQRVDIAPLDEAESFAALLAVPNATAESVAAKLGKAPSYVGRRLKLLDSVQVVREALKAGAIDVGHALELARLDEDQQKRFLDWLEVGFAFEDDDSDEDSEDGDVAEAFESGVCRYCECTENNACDTEDGPCHWIDVEKTICSGDECLTDHARLSGVITWRQTRRSLADLKSHIARTRLKVLASAPFPLDADMPPVACVNCPKRSVNAALLFDDYAQDTCTDRDCFDTKVKVWIRAELQRADRDKQPLVMLRAGYYGGVEFKSTVSTHSIEIIPDMRPPQPCESQEHAIYVTGDKAGHLTMICRDLKCKTHASAGGGSSSGSRTAGGSRADEAKQKAERTKKLAKLLAEKKYRAALFAAVAKAPINTLYAGDLNLEVCLFAIGRGPGQYKVKVAEALGWPKEIFGYGGSKALKEKIVSLTPVERLRVALLAAHAGELTVNEYAMDSKPVDLEKLAAFLGVDPTKIRASLDNPTKPKAAKSVPAKPTATIAEVKTVVLTADAKKRIADAQRKRFAAAKKAAPAKKAAAKKAPAKKAAKKKGGAK